MKRETQKQGITFLNALGLTFLVLKIAGLINWSWWLVLLPFYSFLLIVLIVLIIAFILIVIDALRK